MSLTPLCSDLPSFLEPYLPTNNKLCKVGKRPFITLTYAQSLDSRISKGHGIRTVISHEETKTMTHYLRYHHDGILIGTGTVMADDPGLNCKWRPASESLEDFECSPRPIIIDLNQKWTFTGSKMWELYKAQQGKSPIIIVHDEPVKRESDVSYLVIKESSFDWVELVIRLYKEYDIKSLMIEGGAYIINQLLLRQDLVDSLIVTIGSTYLGHNGVEVSPSKPLTLSNVNWWKGTRDSIMCAILDEDEH